MRALIVPVLLAGVVTVVGGLFYPNTVAGRIAAFYLSLIGG